MGSWPLVGSGGGVYKDTGAVTVVALMGSACQFLQMKTMSIIMETSLYLFLFQYICFYAVEVLLTAARNFVINMNVMAHG